MPASRSVALDLMLRTFMNSSEFHSSEFHSSNPRVWDNIAKLVPGTTPQQVSEQRMSSRRPLILRSSCAYRVCVKISAHTLYFCYLYAVFLHHECSAVRGGRNCAVSPAAQWLATTLVIYNTH